MLAFWERVAIQRDYSETPRFCRCAPARRSKEIQSALAGINSSAASCPVGGGAQPQAQEQKEQARQAGSDDGGEAAAEELTTTSGRPPEQDAWSVIDIELRKKKKAIFFRAAAT